MVPLPNPEPSASAFDQVEEAYPPPRHGAAMDEDVAQLALRHASLNPDMADEALGLIVSLEIAKRH